MYPLLLETIAPLLAMMGLGGLILVGMKLRYSHLQRTRAGGVAGPELEKLTGAVESLRDEVRLMHDEYSELSARLDFAERLLTGSKAREAASDARTERPL